MKTHKLRFTNRITEKKMSECPAYDKQATEKISMFPACDTHEVCSDKERITERASADKQNNCYKINCDRRLPFLTDERYIKNSASAGNQIILCDQKYNVYVSDENPVTQSINTNPTADIDPVTIFTRDDDEDTLLHTAIILKDSSNSLIFISKAPTYTWLSLTNLLFQTPLHLAVLTDQPEVVRRLVVAGADVTSQDKDGNTALHIACRDGKQEILTYLLEPVQYYETKQNEYEIPYQQIPQDFSVRNFNGYTCLHLAASSGHINIVEVLVNYDIDLNTKEGKTGRTILHNACLRGDIDLVKFLIRHIACDINARAFDGNTPFDLARASGHDNVCLALAAEGARYGEEQYDSEEER